MTATPKWYLPVAVVALLWNGAGCAAYLSDVMMTPDDIAKLTVAQQALYAARPAWSVAATAIAVWCGVAGCFGLLLRRRWAAPLFLLSLVGVIAQDVALFGLSGAASQADPTVFFLQGLVLVVAIGLVMLSRNAVKEGWVT